MKLSEFKHHLENLQALHFVLPNGKSIPSHFHITEAGLVSKQFIDCGGTIRSEKMICFQIWVANDTDHRLDAKKILKIISLSETIIGQEDLDIEIEYQTDTLGKYGLTFENGSFQLKTRYTDCLAKELCGFPLVGVSSASGVLANHEKSCCSPGSSCC